MVKGLLKRLFPLLCCIVILISCLIVPASALSPAVNPETPDSKAYPFINGSMFYTVAENYDAESLYGSSYGLADFMDPIYQGYFGSDAHIMSQRHDDIEAGPEQWYIVQQCFLENDSSTNYKRLHEVWDVRDYANVSQDFFTWSVTFSFDDFGGYWNRTILNKLFYLHGQYTFLTECVVYTINDDGELLQDYFNLNGTAKGAQSVLYGSFLQTIEKKLGISEGDPFMMSLEVSIPFGVQYQDLHISRLGSLCSTFYFTSPADPTAVYVDAPYHHPNDPVGALSWSGFLYNDNLITGQPDIITGELNIDDAASFLTTAAGGFLDAELFDGFTLGGILGIFIAVSVVMWLLKVFAGG